MVRSTTRDYSRWDGTRLVDGYGQRDAHWIPINGAPRNMNVSGKVVGISRAVWEAVTDTDYTLRDSRRGHVACGQKGCLNPWHGPIPWPGADSTAMCFTHVLRDGRYQRRTAKEARAAYDAYQNLIERNPPPRPGCEVRPPETQTQKLERLTKRRRPPKKKESIK
jgi:hypothetical protein